ncbi:MAG: hypothetical protein ACRC11_10345 [Xenococcaceae cyanobacterium]
MTQPQHYRMTLDCAIAEYKEGMISSFGLLYYYFKIKFAPGWKIRINPSAICCQLGLSKDQFYRAFRKIKEKFPQFKFKTISATVGTMIAEEAVVKSTTDDADGATDAVNSPTPVEESADRVVPIATDTPLKVKQDKHSCDRPNFLSSSFQSFFHSLSQTTRERFLKFVIEKTKDFKPQINDVCGWLAGKNQAGEYRWRVYYDIFQSEVGEGVAPSQDWQNHPLWDIAIQCMRRGLPRFLAIGYPECEELDSKTRKAMADYAEANKLIWGKA